MPPFHLVLFLEISSVLSFWTCFFVSTFWLLPYICFYVLGRVATSPRSGRVVLCSRCPAGPSGAASAVTQVVHSRCAPVGTVCTAVVVEPQLLLALLGGIDPPGQSSARTNYNYSRGAAVQESTLQSRTCFSGLWCSLSPPLECAVCGGDRVVIWCGLKPSMGCTGPGVS